MPRSTGRSSAPCSPCRVDDRCCRCRTRRGRAWFAGNNDSFFSTRFLSTTIVQYLRPDAIRFERLIPFIRFGPVAENRASYPLLGNTPSSSLTLTATLLLRPGRGRGGVAVRRRARLWLLVVAGTTLGALPTFAIGFLAQRYLIDMLPPLAVAGSIGIWVLGGWTVVVGRDSAGGRRRCCRAGRVGRGSTCRWRRGRWSRSRPASPSLRYRVDGWIFPDPAPGLVADRPDGSGARDGCGRSGIRRRGSLHRRVHRRAGRLGRHRAGPTASDPDRSCRTCSVADRGR